MSKLRATSGLRFGERADIYHKGRKGYPPFIIDCIEQEVGRFGVPASDVGCGTGVATRQLSERWPVTGIDDDGRMLSWARSIQSMSPPARFPIVYKRGHANKLPLTADSQQLVTCFAAFHWFATAKVASEFKRVLIPGGVVCIAHQMSHPADLFRVAWRSVLAHYLGAVPKQHKEEIGYNPRFVTQLLRDGGFNKLKIRSIEHTERYTINEAMARVQSMTYWKSIKEDDQKTAVRSLRIGFETLLKHGEDTIPRKTIAWSILATKPP